MSDEESKLFGIKAHLPLPTGEIGAEHVPVPDGAVFGTEWRDLADPEKVQDLNLRRGPMYIHEGFELRHGQRVRIVHPDGREEVGYVSGHGTIVVPQAE